MSSAERHSHSTTEQRAVTIKASDGTLIGSNGTGSPLNPLAIL